MPECVRIADRPDHTAVAEAKFHTISLPKPSDCPLDVGSLAGRISSNTKRMIRGHHVLEEVARR